MHPRMPDTSDIIFETHKLPAHPSEGRLERTKADQRDDPLPDNQKPRQPAASEAL